MSDQWTRLWITHLGEPELAFYLNGLVVANMVSEEYATRILTELSATPTEDDT